MTTVSSRAYNRFSCFLQSQVGSVERSRERHDQDVLVGVKVDVHLAIRLLGCSLLQNLKRTCQLEFSDKIVIKAGPRLHVLKFPNLLNPIMKLLGP